MRVIIYHGVLFIIFRYEGDKLVCPKVVVASPIAAYENTVEVQSLEQLEDIISDPDEMRMQALLVRERILGPAHPDTSYYIRYRGAVYADMGHFERCITLWMYALDMQQKMLEPLSLMTQSSLLRYTIYSQPEFLVAAFLEFQEAADVRESSKELEKPF